MSRLTVSMIFVVLGGMIVMLAGAQTLSARPLILGTAIALIAIAQWKRRKWAGTMAMTQGWAGASLIGPSAGLAFGALYLQTTQDCSGLEPGIFILTNLLVLLPAWITGWALGARSTLTLALPLSLSLFLGFIGTAVLLLTPALMACTSLDIAFLLTMLGCYLMGWSGMVVGVRA